MTRQPGVTANHRQSCTQNLSVPSNVKALASPTLCPGAASLSCLHKGCAAIMSPVVIKQHDAHPRGPCER